MAFLILGPAGAEESRIERTSWVSLILGLARARGEQTSGSAVGGSRTERTQWVSLILVPARARGERTSGDPSLGTGQHSEA